MILYAAFWAANVLYGLVPLAVTFLLMALVTVVCCLLALRHDALVIAVLGLVGGFATPLLLSSGPDRPIGLFGYVLLLDLGLLVLGQRRRWPSLALLSLVGTVLIQGLWIGGRMGPERSFLGLAVLAVFAALFVLAARVVPGTTAARPWLWSQVGAILFPFAFAVYFAARVDLGPRLWPVALLLALLIAAAGWVARERGAHALGAGAAAGCVAVVGTWALRHPVTDSAAWELVAVSVALALIFHAFVEADRDNATLAGPAGAALASASGFFALLVLMALAALGTLPWPWLAGWIGLAALLYRHAALPARSLLQPATAFALGGALSLLHVSEPLRGTFPRATVWLAVLVAAALAAHAVAVLRADAGGRRHADHAAALLPVMLLCGLAVTPRLSTMSPLLALGGSLLLGILAATAATRLASGGWSAAAVAGTVLVHAFWTVFRANLASHPREAAIGLGVAGLAVVVFTAWPFLTAPRFTTNRWAWYAAALAGPIWFLPMKRLFTGAFGDRAIGLLPLALGAVALAAVARARNVWPAREPLRLTAVVWFAAVALGFLSVAIPLQLEKEWITIGWALEGLAVIALWRRLDHPGLKYFGVALLGATGARLVANPAVLGYYPRSTVRIVNWLAYTYLVPAAAMVGAGALLGPLECARLRPKEREFYGRPQPLLAIATFGAAVVVVFVWINLAICDWYASGSRITLSFGATPAQRLTMSIAWAVYALLLLGLGMQRDHLGLRWASLGFLVVTIGKVFLYDLGALRDLYRVASLVGLAASLILVSLLYQRFVFRRGP